MARHREVASDPSRDGADPPPRCWDSGRRRPAAPAAQAVACQASGSSMASTTRPVVSGDGTAAVFGTLARHVDPGQTGRVLAALPEGMGRKLHDATMGCASHSNPDAGERLETHPRVAAGARRSDHRGAAGGGLRQRPGEDGGGHHMLLPTSPPRDQRLRCQLRYEMPSILRRPGPPTT